MWLRSRGGAKSCQIAVHVPSVLEGDMSSDTVHISYLWASSARSPCFSSTPGGLKVWPLDQEHQQLPGNVIEMQIIKTFLDLESQILGEGLALCFKKPSR